MADAGATAARIAAVSGHTIDQTARILDTYIPRRAEVAAGAIEAWEHGRERGRVVPIGAGRQSGKEFESSPEFLKLKPTGPTSP